jgi:hypothetical protein
MTKSPFPIALFPVALAAAALIALSGCETTDAAGPTAVAQSSDTIHWNTPRPAEGTATEPPAPQAQPVQPVEPAQPAPPMASPQPVPQATQTGPECREFQNTVTIGGKPVKAYGRACRQPDGTWKQVGEAQPTPHPGSQPVVEQSFPYGWHGYDYPNGPYYGPGGASISVGGGSRGGFVGYGVGF